MRRRSVLPEERFKKTTLKCKIKRYLLSSLRYPVQDESNFIEHRRKKRIMVHLKHDYVTNFRKNIIKS